MIFGFIFAIMCVVVSSPVVMFVTLDGAKTNMQFWLGVITGYTAAALFGFIFGLIVDCVVGCVCDEVAAFRRRTKAQALAKKHD